MPGGTRGTQASPESCQRRANYCGMVIYKVMSVTASAAGRCHFADTGVHGS